MGNKPVNYVSWYDSVRFANWLNNGQGSGDTESGAYKLLGNSATPSNGLSVIRDPAAKHRPSTMPGMNRAIRTTADPRWRPLRRRIPP